MTSMGLVVSKLIFGIILGIGCFTGTLTPRLTQALVSPAQYTGLLPYAACFSAGLLLGTGLLHFFAGSVKGFFNIYLAAGHSTHAHDGNTLGNEHQPFMSELSAALTTATSMLLVGIGISLLLDRIVMRFLRFSPSHPSETSIIDGGRTRTLPVFMADDPEELYSSAQPHKPLLPPVVSSVAIVGVLLGFHSMLEGMALAAEPSIQSLQRGFLPLLVHKIFDGLVLGVQLAKVQQHDGGSPGSPVSSAPSLPNSPFHRLLSSGNQRRTILATFLWSLTTPLSLILTLLCFGSDSSSAGGYGAHQQNSTHQHSAKMPATAPMSPIGPMLQAFGAGTFLYISLFEILQEEFQDASHTENHQHVEEARAKKRSCDFFRGMACLHLKKFLILVVGSFLVVVMESSHHHR